MKRSMMLGGLAAAMLAGSAGAQALPHTDGMPDIVFPPQPQVQQIPLSPGLTPSYDYRQIEVTAAAPKVPEGFTPIFNGKDLTGWHTSKTARHGTTPDFRAIQGVIIGTQAPIGRGGLLITDKKYKNYEFYMEAKADWGADSGIFLRTTEEGAAYQLTLDYLPGGSMGRIIQEGGLIGVGRPVGQETAPAAPRPATPPGPPAADPGMSAWKHNEWNSVRVRVTGDNPHVTVWINDKQITDFTDPANRAVGGMTTGPIALQIHGGPHRWLPGNFWRWRNIGIKELP
ncbi:MAG: hypothetical protein BGN86_11910 [Caulobacterales bacterium 68-7]|nr:MAG: hypothetical protein BGN86_11910 [Caulobacterales bacterium 68-7]